MIVDERLEKFLENIEKGFTSKEKDGKLEIYDKYGNHPMTIYHNGDYSFHITEEFRKVSRSMRKVLLDSAFELRGRK